MTWSLPAPAARRLSSIRKCSRTPCASAAGAPCLRLTCRFQETYPPTAHRSKTCTCTPSTTCARLLIRPKKSAKAPCRRPAASWPPKWPRSSAGCGFKMLRTPSRPCVVMPTSNAATCCRGRSANWQQAPVPKPCGTGCPISSPAACCIRQAFGCDRQRKAMTWMCWTRRATTWSRERKATVNEGLRHRLAEARERMEELQALLATPEVIDDRKRFESLAREYGELEPLIGVWDEFSQTETALEDTRQLFESSADDMREMARDELEDLTKKFGRLEQQLQTLLLPRDPNDERNIFVEIRAGTGGQEAAIFAGDLLRMYTRYAENRGWQVELMSAQPGDAGGFREVIARLIGDGAYSRLKFESGVHRVQRVPETESQGRIHTSACTVAILPEVDDVEAVDINPAELKIDTFRASGAGGQHVNTTDSAIRITHLPTGLVVECQDERSQHKNRARAMSLLGARLLEEQRRQQQDEQAAERRLQVGSGDRSERIRTYNFPQGRITDHRIGLTLYDLEQIMEGELDSVISPLLEAHQAELLSELTAGAH